MLLPTMNAHDAYDWISVCREAHGRRGLSDLSDFSALQSFSHVEVEIRGRSKLCPRAAALAA